MITLLLIWNLIVLVFFMFTFSTMDHPAGRNVVLVLCCTLLANLLALWGTR